MPSIGVHTERVLFKEERSEKKVKVFTFVFYNTNNEKLYCRLKARTAPENTGPFVHSNRMPAEIGQKLTSKLDDSMDKVKS